MKFLSWIYVPYTDNNDSCGDFATVAIWSMEKSDASTRSTQSWWMGSRYSRLHFWDLCLSWMGLLGWIFSPRQFYGLETDFCWKWNWDQVCISSLILCRVRIHIQRKRRPRKRTFQAMETIESSIYRICADQYNNEKSTRKLFSISSPR